jgi:hypothetical protein
MNHISNILTVAIAGLLGATSVARAAVVMEWDFRTNEHLTVIAGNGVSNSFLLGTATVNTGAAVPVPPANVDPIQTGSLSVPRTGNTDPSGLATSNTLGAWRNYFGREAFGTGTVYIVFRPHFSGSNNFNGASGRATIFNFNDFNSFDSFGINLETEGTLGPSFDLGRDVYNSPRVELPGFAWNSNSWYLIGGTWADGAPIGLYLRVLDTNKPAAMFGTSSLSLIEPTNAFKFANTPFHVGRRASPTSPENADSDIALIRVLNNEYFSQAHFDSVYESLIIPEPSALLLLGLAGVAMIARRRTR